MPKAHKKWTVLPHGRLAEVDKNIWTVIGYLQMPFTVLPRRMTLVRISGGRLVVYSAIALDESGMRVLEEYGQPAFLVVPSDKHRLDAKIWMNRYPEMQVVAPEGSRKKVGQVVHVDTVHPRFDDPNVEFVTVPGTRKREAALVIHTADGTTLVLNDLVGNIRNSKGFGGWFLRWMKFAGSEPRIPRPVKWALIEDPVALRAQFLKWAELPKLKRILLSHGETIDSEPAEVLRDLAESLVQDMPEYVRLKTA